MITNERLIPVLTEDDIPADLKNTPIALMLEYHNFKRPFDTFENAQLLVGMCMDHRKYLSIPENFAYIIRTGGGNMRYSDFKISYAIAIGDVKHIVLMAHNNCGMVNIVSRKEQFINGLIKNAGWTEEFAHQHFMTLTPFFEIENEIDFVINEVFRIRNRYPAVKVVPVYYELETNNLYLIKE